MQKVKKIMLIQPPVTRPKDFSSDVVRISVFFPLGIGYLAAVIEKTGKYEVSILDALIEGDVDRGTTLEGGQKIRYGLTDQEIAERVKDFSPDLVGVSCLFSAMQPDMVNVCKIIKKVNPKIKTVVGGTHVSLMAKEILLESEAIDFAIEGEAEITLLEFLKSLEEGKGFSHLNGFVFRKQGSVEYKPKNQYIEDLDSLPHPARHLVNMNKYFDSAKSHGFYRETPYTQMITSRGCPCKCTFCALGDHWGSRQRLRSAEDVFDEIEYLIKEYGVKEIHFEDDNLTGDKKRAIELFDGMIERKFNIKWHIPSGIAVYTLSEDFLDKMKASGCYSISLAIESGNQDVVTNLMNKPVNLKVVPDLATRIRKAGMDVRGFFIIGFPGETKETIQQTIDFARSIELDWTYFSIASPLPHTEMYKTCIKKGYIKDKDFDPIRSFHRSIIRTPEFDPEYLYQVREQAIIDVCFKNNPNLLKYNIDRAIGDFKEVTNRYPHFDFANFYLGEAYLKKGLQSEAVDSYQKALATNPSHQKARQRLQELGVQQNKVMHS